MRMRTTRTKMRMVKTVRMTSLKRSLCAKKMTSLMTSQMTFPNRRNQKSLMTTMTATKRVRRMRRTKAMMKMTRSKLNVMTIRANWEISISTLIFCFVCEVCAAYVVYVVYGVYEVCEVNVLWKWIQG